MPVIRTGMSGIGLTVQKKHKVVRQCYSARHKAKSLSGNPREVLTHIE